MTDVDQFIGQIFDDRFQIVRLLGQGGWSRVYEAQHLQLSRKVALKVLHTHLRDDEEQMLRFQREAEIACRLRHPNIAQVLDYGLSSRGEPFIVMEFLDGSGLDAILASKGRLDTTTSVNLISQICDGLHLAHENGIVHRDLKPGNLVVIEGERLKILDFGLAKVLSNFKQGDMRTLTETGETMGTPEYMSPEQCLGLEITNKSDIYSLGCIAYELLTGKKAVGGESLFELMHAHVDMQPLPFQRELQIPEAVEEVIFIAMGKRAQDRYSDVLQFKNDLQQALRGKRPHRRHRSAARPAWSRAVSYALAVVVFGAIVGGGITAAGRLSVASATTDSSAKILELESRLSSNPAFDYATESALINLLVHSNQRDKALRHINVVLKNVPIDLEMAKVMSNEQWAVNPEQAVDELSKTARFHADLPYVAASCDIFIGDIFAERPDAKLARKYYNNVMNTGGADLASYRQIAKDRLNTLVKLGM